MRTLTRPGGGNQKARLRVDGRRSSKLPRDLSWPSTCTARRGGCCEPDRAARRRAADSVAAGVAVQRRLGILPERWTRDRLSDPAGPPADASPRLTAAPVRRAMM